MDELTGRRTRSPRVLVVHDRAPGQFGAFATWLAKRGWDVIFATAGTWEGCLGIRVCRYAPHRDPSPATHPYAQPMDRAALRGQAVARTALALRREGWAPDIIMSHAGLGAGAFVKDIFPAARLVAYAEWWYNHPGVDVTFLAKLGFPQPRASAEAALHERSRNAPLALELSAADAVIAPTRFQAAQLPCGLRQHLHILPDGVDTGQFVPAPADLDRTLGGLVPADAPIVTYATRGMEPHRGFPQFMAALAEVLARRPDAIGVVGGKNEVVYGGDHLRSTDWKARALAELEIDMRRVHFVGPLDLGRYIRLIQRSDAHVYLTVPFVLSWSMLEAMSMAAPLILSNTAPVGEFADHTEARLVGFDRSDISGAILETLAGGAGLRPVRARGRMEEQAGLEAACAARARLLADLL